MIRRWSHINEINNFENNFFFFKKKNKLNIFKKSVTLKRFNKKYTKIRRKSFSRLKRVKNWYVYHNVFKSWTIDFQKNKYQIKYQVLEGLFLNNFFFFHKNFLNGKSNLADLFSFHFNTFSKKTLTFFYFKSLYGKQHFSNFFLFSFKFHNITRSWSFNNSQFFVEMTDKDNSMIFYSEWDKQLFPLEETALIVKDNNFNLTRLLNFLNYNFLFKIKSLYEICVYFLI